MICDCDCDCDEQPEAKLSHVTSEQQNSILNHFMKTKDNVLVR